MLFISFPVAQQPDWGIGRLVVEVSRTHTITDTYTHSVGFFRTSNPAQRRDRYLHNIQQTKRRKPTPSAGFKPAIPAIEEPQTYALHRRVTGIGPVLQLQPSNNCGTHCITPAYSPTPRCTDFYSLHGVREQTRQRANGTGSH